MQMNARELLPLLRLHGRTLYDEGREALFFNWTCAGFTARFRGRTLRARLVALGDAAPVFPGMPPLPPVFPYFGVVPDGADAPERCQVLDRPDAWVTLFEGEDGEHSVRLVKLSENTRGKLALLELETDGEILPAPALRAKRIEIVGDSISCGLGNRTTAHTFNVAPDEEDGWMSYGALAARELGCEWSIVAESGIEVSRPEKPFFEKHGMDEIYAFTDELYQNVHQHAAPARWDFAAQPNDAVVINLGTNDGNTTRFYPELGLTINDVPRMEAHFQAKYGDFLRTVRALNGPDALIACTLGSMDYYLWDRLRDAVEDYKKESGDERVALFKFVAINEMTEGIGAGGHPSVKTHRRMGHELANLLRPWLFPEGE